MRWVGFCLSLFLSLFLCPPFLHIIPKCELLHFHFRTLRIDMTNHRNLEKLSPHCESLMVEGPLLSLSHCQMYLTIAPNWNKSCDWHPPSMWHSSGGASVITRFFYFSSRKWGFNTYTFLHSFHLFDHSFLMDGLCHFSVVTIAPKWVTSSCVLVKWRL